MASTHGTAQASAAGGLTARSTQEGAKFLYPLTRVATIISACAFEPDTAETALQSGAADTIVVGCHPVSNPDLPRRIERRTCACNVPQNLQVRYAWLQ